MRLVGFIVRIYHDAARSPERQIFARVTDGRRSRRFKTVRYVLHKYRINLRQVCWVLQLANGVALTSPVDGYLCVSEGDLQLTAQISLRYEFGVYVDCGIVELKRTLCAVWTVQWLFWWNLYQTGCEWVV